MDKLFMAVKAVQAVERFAPELLERVVPAVGAESKILEQLARVGKNATVEAVTSFNEKVVGKVLKLTRIGEGRDARTVAVMDLPEAIARTPDKADLPVVSLTDTGKLWSDKRGFVFHTDEAIFGESPHPSELNFVNKKFAVFPIDMQILGRTGELTKAEIQALTDSAKHITASVGHTETLLSSLSQAPKLDFAVTPLLGFSTKPVFNPLGQLTNCMTATAGILRTMRTGSLTTASQVENLSVTGTTLGPSIPGTHQGLIAAEDWFQKAAGANITRRVSTIEEMAPGKPHAVDLMLKGADGEQRHYAFAYKFKDGRSFIYDAQSGFVWHPDAILRNKSPISYRELKLQKEPQYN